MSCLFCHLSAGTKPCRIVATYEHCFATWDDFPVSKGHLLLIAKEHTDNWFTAHEALRIDIVKALTHAKALLDAQFQPDGYNIGANCGAVAGQTVMHLHVHLIPRYQDDMINPKGGVRGVIPDKQKY